VLCIALGLPLFSSETDMHIGGVRLRIGTTFDDAVGQLKRASISVQRNSSFPESDNAADGSWFALDSRGESVGLIFVYGGRVIQVDKVLRYSKDVHDVEQFKALWRACQTLVELTRNQQGDFGRGPVEISLSKIGDFDNAMYSITISGQGRDWIDVSMAQRYEMDTKRVGPLSVEITYKYH
jgi:hypothetical protein